MINLKKRKNSFTKKRFLVQKALKNKYRRAKNKYRRAKNKYRRAKNKYIVFRCTMVR